MLINVYHDLPFAENIRMQCEFALQLLPRAKLIKLQELHAVSRTTLTCFKFRRLKLLTIRVRKVYDIHTVFYNSDENIYRYIIFQRCFL